MSYYGNVQRIILDHLPWTIYRIRRFPLDDDRFPNTSMAIVITDANNLVIYIELAVFKHIHDHVSRTNPADLDKSNSIIINLLAQINDIVPVSIILIQE